MRKLSLLLGFFITIHIATFAQKVDFLKLHYNYFSHYLSPEKLYLHIDRNIFAPGRQYGSKDTSIINLTSHFFRLVILCM